MFGTFLPSILRKSKLHDSVCGLFSCPSDLFPQKKPAISARTKKSDVHHGKRSIFGWIFRKAAQRTGVVSRVCGRLWMVDIFWIYLRCLFTFDSTKGNHHEQASFGRMVLEHFPSILSKSKFTLEY